MFTTFTTFSPTATRLLPERAPSSAGKPGGATVALVVSVVLLTYGVVGGELNGSHVVSASIGAAGYLLLVLLQQAQVKARSKVAEKTDARSLESELQEPPEAPGPQARKRPRKKRAARAADAAPEEEAPPGEAALPDPPPPASEAAPAGLAELLETAPEEPPPPPAEPRAEDLSAAPADKDGFTLAVTSKRAARARTRLRSQAMVEAEAAEAEAKQSSAAEAQELSQPKGEELLLDEFKLRVGKPPGLLSPVQRSCPSTDLMKALMAAEGCEGTLALDPALAPEPANLPVELPAAVQQPAPVPPAAAPELASLPVVPLGAQLGREVLEELTQREETCWSWARKGYCLRGPACWWKHPPLRMEPTCFASAETLREAMQACPWK